MQQAAQAVVGELAAAGGAGGVIAVDRLGAPVLLFNTARMHRGCVREGEAVHTAICGEPYRVRAL